MKDKIRPIVCDAIEKIVLTSGTNEQGAMRDIITEIMQICDEKKLNFEFLLGGATEVYEEEKT